MGLFSVSVDYRYRRNSKAWRRRQFLFTVQDKTRSIVLEELERMHPYCIVEIGVIEWL